MFWVGAALAGASILSGSAASNAAKRAQRLQAKMTKLKNKRQLQFSGVEFQQKRAQATASIGAEEDFGSSTYQGATSAMSMQLLENIAFMNKMTKLGGAISDANQSAATYQSWGNMLGTAGNLFMGDAGEKMADAFKKDPPAPPPVWPTDNPFIDTIVNPPDTSGFA